LHNLSRKISLESELIIYRHFLEIDEIQQYVVIDSPALVQSTVMKTFIIERQKIGLIGIGECRIEKERVKESNSFLSFFLKNVLSITHTYVW
jgi:hypothetical protein